MRQVMLTTSDNPYDPFDQFDAWNAWDEQMGYCTCAYLGRIATTSPVLSASDQAEIVEQAIDEIVAMNLTGNYVKVVKE